MKVKNIPRHTVVHMWDAYVKRILNENPTWWSKARKTVGKFYVYRPDGDGQVEVINYEIFRTIIEDYLNLAKKAIINGECLYLSSVGRICAKRIQRDFRGKKKSVDWKRSHAAGVTTVDGKKKFNKLYFRTEDDYCRIGWFKAAIENISMYMFLPAKPGISDREGGGFSKQFSNALISDPLLRFKYLFCPLRDYVLIENE